MEPATLISAAYYVLSAFLVGAVGWLAKTVIDIKSELNALKSRQDYINNDVNRRFGEISASLISINGKLDRLVERERKD
jgi:hypothetical protein